MFPNNIHMNARSYFDRKREPEDMSASKQRKKVTNDDKYTVEIWSLQNNNEYHREDGKKVDFSSTLRASYSAPALPIEDACRKTAPAWFSSHGVIF